MRFLTMTDLGSKKRERKFANEKERMEEEEEKWWERFILVL
jgi:hypothetical protein